MFLHYYMDYKNISAKNISAKDIDFIIVDQREDLINSNHYKGGYNSYNKNKDNIINDILINSKIVFEIKNNRFDFALNKFYSILESKKMGIDKNHINGWEKFFNKSEISDSILKDILLNIFTLEQLNVINSHLDCMIELRN